MMNLGYYPKQLVSIAQSSPVLVATSVLMLVLLLGCLIGIVIDPRSILGAPAWLKPAKFTISISLFCLSMAWLFQFIEGKRTLKTFIAWTISSVTILEIAIIIVQVFRGTTSHFNQSTLLDGLLYDIMGASIAVLMGATTLALWAIWRQPFKQSSLRHLMRWSIGLTVLGGFLAVFMLPPTSSQWVYDAFDKLPYIGAHTVGAPDGGEGFPITNWSSRHGDLRIPHFLGLHALQLLPLLYFLLIHRQRLSELQQVRLINILGYGYLGTLMLLLIQALRGQALLSPDSITIFGFSFWILSLSLAVFQTLNPHHALSKLWPIKVILS